MRTRLWLVGMCAALLLAGCARPPKPGIDNIYRGLNERVPRLDPGLLSGRRIVVDPGHGGHFDGTRGQEGLEESSVNLGVSLYLWGLLHEAGADVYLTRSAQRDFLAGPDSTVAADLQVRVDMVDSIRPDIVVSIHHNAQPQHDPNKNAVETYYKMGDPASRDLAFGVHRHLIRNLGIEAGAVRPGNYYILREVDVPAILGEGSYLTHPEVEEKLRLSEKQRLEAEAYFLGILEYFSRGTPVIDEMAPAPGDSILAEVPTLVYALTDVGGIGIDPAGIEMLVNGAPVRAALDPAGATVRYRPPWDLPNGFYNVTLYARNLLGNSSRIHRRTFLLSYPAKRSVFSSYPENIPPGGGIIYVRARLLDRRGLSVAEGSRVGVAAWYQTSPGGGWKPLRSESEGQVNEVYVKGGVVEFPAHAPAGTSAIRVAVSPQGKLGVDGAPDGPVGPPSFEYVIDLSNAAVAPGRSVVLLNQSTRTPIEDARFSGSEGPISAESRCSRFVLTGAGAQTGEVWVQATGYRPTILTAGAPDTLFLEPWYGGKLLGKRLVINPESGAGAESAHGRLGLAGMYVNLQVARYLQEYVEAAGALVELTRRTEETPPDGDIVTLTNRFHADQYVEIRYRNGSEDSALAVRTFHFPGSQKGRFAAEVIGRTMGEVLGVPAVSPSEMVTFPLQHTACPAIIVEPPSLDRIDEELRLSEPWYQRKQAFGIFCGLLRHAGVDSAATLHVVLAPDSVVEPSQESVSNWLVTVDDTWRLLTSPDGVARFEWLSPSAHRVVLRHAGRIVGPVEISLRSGEQRVLKIVIPPSR